MKETKDNRPCTKENCHKCENMQEDYSTWDKTVYECPACGLGYTTYEDEMK